MRKISLSESKPPSDSRTHSVFRIQEEVDTEQLFALIRRFVAGSLKGMSGLRRVFGDDFPAIPAGFFNGRGTEFQRHHKSYLSYPGLKQKKFDLVKNQDS